MLDADIFLKCISRLIAFCRNGKAVTLELFKAYGFLVCKRMVLPHYHGKLVTEEIAGLDLIIWLVRFESQHKVHLPVAEHLHKFRHVPVEYIQFDARILLDEILHGLRKYLAERVCYADVEFACKQLLEVIHLCLAGFGVLKGLYRKGQEHGPAFSEGCRVGVTLEKDCTEFVLQRLYLLRKRALADIQAARSLREIQSLSRPDKKFQLFDFHDDSPFQCFLFILQSYIFVVNITSMEHSSKERSIIWLESTDSTNDELRRRLDQSGDLAIIAAERQSAGRGQGDHTWHSEPGRNLTFSVLLRHRCLKASDALAVTSIMALGIRDYLHTKGIEPWIKWPNDIWVGEKKICGILVENSMRAGKIDFSIVGVGLDVNQTDWPADLPNPVSLKDLTGLEYDTHEELKQLFDALARRSTQVSTPEGTAAIIDEFSAVVVRLDRTDSNNNR